MKQYRYGTYFFLTFLPRSESFRWTPKTLIRIILPCVMHHVLDHEFPFNSNYPKMWHTSRAWWTTLISSGSWWRSTIPRISWPLRSSLLSGTYSSVCCVYIRVPCRHVQYLMIHSWAGKVELMALDAKLILLSTSVGNAGKNKNKECGIVEIYFKHKARFIKK